MYRPQPYPQQYPQQHPQRHPQQHPMLRLAGFLALLLLAAGAPAQTAPEAVPVSAPVAGLPTAPAATPAASPKPNATTTLVEAAPERGFHYPYLLVVPATALPGSGNLAAPGGSGAAAAPPGFLLVEPNNTGRLSDDLAVHLAAARDLATQAIGGYLARELAVPLLVPVFPRPETQWELYTHQLDRDTLWIADGPMRRLDLQLLAMIEDARARLASQGIAVARKVLMTGFSASGSFVNRFTAIHPEQVQAVAAGGLNGILILPVETLGGRSLPYPLGVADLAAASGHAFDAVRWREVPQFLYMGALDDNDAVQYDDGYTAAEKSLVDAVIGAKMQPDRWEHCQKLYREAGATATFRTFPEVGHFTTREVNEAIRDFFRQHLMPQK